VTIYNNYKSMIGYIRKCGVKSNTL